MSEVSCATRLASFLSCSTSFLNLLRHIKPRTTISKSSTTNTLNCVDPLTFLYHASCLVDYFKEFYQSVNMPILKEDLALSYLIPLHLGSYQYLATVGSCAGHCDLSSQGLVMFHKLLKRRPNSISFFSYASRLQHSSVTKLRCDILVIKLVRCLSIHYSIVNFNVPYTQTLHSSMTTMPNTYYSNHIINQLSHIYLRMVWFYAANKMWIGLIHLLNQNLKGILELCTNS